MVSYKIKLLEEQISKNNPDLVIDVGSGCADYLLSSAKLNPDSQYLAIDPKYSNSDIPEKLENIEYIIADTNFLPFKSEISDLTTSFAFPYSDDQIFHEMHRITKISGIAINSPLSDDTFGLLSSEVSDIERLKDLLTDSLNLWSKYDVDSGRESLFKEESGKIYENMKEIIDYPVDEIYSILGLNIIQKVPIEEDTQNNSYALIWGKGEPQKNNIILIKNHPQILTNQLHKLIPSSS